MNCYDCSLEHARTVSVAYGGATAVAVCSVCGVGLCEKHAHVGRARVETHSMGNPSSADLPGRRVFCAVCDPADNRPAPVTARAEVPTTV